MLCNEFFFAYKILNNLFGYLENHNKMNSYKILIAIFGLILTFNIKHSELCSSLVKFPEGGAMAKAIMKGLYNGSVIEGTITFTQAVSKLKYCNTLM